MRGPPRQQLFLLVVTLVLVFASRAHAWTDATVRTGSAEITLQEEGAASVTLRARIRVNGGWLEGFDIEGLDRDAVFDPAIPPVFRDETGITRPMEFTPRSDGRVQLRFRRASAPRRGEYEIELHYRTHLSGLVQEADDGSLDVAWVFPAWRFGLDDVEVVWIAPAGTQPFDRDSEASPIEVVTSSSSAGSRILYRRPHLPRTSDWTTHVHIPAGVWAYVPAPISESSAEEDVEGDAPATSASPSHASTEASTVPQSTPTPAWHASLLLGLIALGTWLKVRGLRARARLAPEVQLRALLPFNPWIRNALLAATLGIAIASLWLEIPRETMIAVALSCAAFGWHRLEPALVRPRMAQLQPIPATVLRAASRDGWRQYVALDSLVDPARYGLLVSAALLGAACLEGDAFSRALAATFVALIMGGTTRGIQAPYQAIREGMRTLAAWRRTPYELQLLGRSTQSFQHIGKKTALRGLPNDVRLRITLRSGAVIESQPDGRSSLHMPAASASQLGALASWATEQGASLESGRIELTKLSPEVARTLDGRLLQRAKEDAAELSLETATLQDETQADLAAE